MRRAAEDHSAQGARGWRCAACAQGPTRGSGVVIVTDLRVCNRTDDFGVLIATRWPARCAWWRAAQVQARAPAWRRAAKVQARATSRSICCARGEVPGRETSAGSKRVGCLPGRKAEGHSSCRGHRIRTCRAHVVAVPRPQPRAHVAEPTSTSSPSLFKPRWGAANSVRKHTRSAWTLWSPPPMVGVATTSRTRTCRERTSGTPSSRRCAWRPPSGRRSSVAAAAAALAAGARSRSSGRCSRPTRSSSPT